MYSKTPDFLNVTDKLYHTRLYSAIKTMFLYINLCISVELDILSFPSTPFLTRVIFLCSSLILKISGVILLCSRIILHKTGRSHVIFFTVPSESYAKQLNILINRTTDTPKCFIGGFIDYVL